MHRYVAHSTDWHKAGVVLCQLLLSTQWLLHCHLFMLAWHERALMYIMLYLQLCPAGLCGECSCCISLAHCVAAACGYGREVKADAAAILECHCSISE